MGKASVTLKVNIDAAGKVTKARVHKSSGSNEIDQPCVVAMYEWWFEPLRDKAGNAVPDAVLFTITFR
jgi:TonB family protein